MADYRESLLESVRLQRGKPLDIGGAIVDHHFRSLGGLVDFCLTHNLTFYIKDYIDSVRRGPVSVCAPELGDIVYTEHIEQLSYYLKNRNRLGPSGDDIELSTLLKGLVGLPANRGQSAVKPAETDFDLSIFLQTKGSGRYVPMSCELFGELATREIRRRSCIPQDVYVVNRNNLENYFRYTENFGVYPLIDEKEQIVRAIPCMVMPPCEMTVEEGQKQLRDFYYKHIYPPGGYCWASMKEEDVQRYNLLPALKEHIAYDGVESKIIRYEPESLRMPDVMYIVIGHWVLARDPALMSEGLFPIGAAYEAGSEVMLYENLLSLAKDELSKEEKN